MYIVTTDLNICLQARIRSPDARIIKSLRDGLERLSHQNEVGYSGSLPQDHPEYLVAARDADLYLNIVDMDRKLSHEYTQPIVSAALDFIADHRTSSEVLVHCNKGQSRSPALAMVFLAKRRNEISDTSYREAKQDFRKRYSGFKPGGGVEACLREYRNQLEWECNSDGN